tara:strand:- start:576 stop:1415 length:840 start_codon:yes stop_codon:yes gene_type:complete
MQKIISCSMCNGKEFIKIRYNNHLNKLKPKIKYLFQKNIFSNKKIIVCKKCGYGNTYIDKAKLDDYYKSLYWNLRSEETENYNGYKTHGRGIYQLKYVINKIKSPKKILEIGGGFCDFSLLLRDKNQDLKIYSDELSSNFKNYYYRNNIELYQKGQSGFDHIHLSHVLEHINNPQNYLNNLFSLLKNNGSIYVEVPNTNKDYYDLNFIDEPHVNFFNKPAFQYLLKKNNFNRSEIEIFGPSWDKLYNFDLGVQSFSDFYKHDFDNKNNNGCLIRLLIYK